MSKKKDKGIRLHPEHGLNPTMGVCQWCDEPDGTIGLLGAGYKGEAPRHMILTPEPCEKCKTEMDKGLTIIEVRGTDGQPTDPIERTGRWCVLSWGSAETWLETEFLKEVRKSGKMMITPDLAKAVRLYDQEVASDNGDTK